MRTLTTVATVLLLAVPASAQVPEKIDTLRVDLPGFVWQSYEQMEEFAEAFESGQFDGACFYGNIKAIRASDTHLEYSRYPTKTYIYINNFTLQADMEAETVCNGAQAAALFAPELAVFDEQNAANIAWEPTIAWLSRRPDLVFGFVVWETKKQLVGTGVVARHVKFAFGMLITRLTPWGRCQFLNDCPMESES